VAGFGVAVDFVELPSQLFEHWLELPSVLTEFALHADTGQPIPDDLRDRLLKARTFGSSHFLTKYLSAALVDMALHRGPAPADPVRAEAEVLERIGLPRAIHPWSFVANFQHAFAWEGYAAGFYSYHWSEVMDRDVFAAFEERGDPFDPDLAQSLERNILAVGGSRDEAESYRAFRGRMPSIEPLLKGRGLLAEAS
jgi:peptidyl-dipeptidase Dcp